MNSVAVPESGAWEPVKNGWRQLYGNFPRSGLSIEQHRFIAAKPLNWGRSFHSDSLELCLNASGHGVVRDRTNEAVFQDNTIGFYCNTRPGLQAVRHPGGEHAFITLEMSREYMARHVEPFADGLQPVIRGWLGKKQSPSSAGPVGAMSVAQQALFAGLSQPPVSQTAFGLWYQSKTLELLSQVLFQANATEELFCQRHKRVARERVERVLAILREQLADPPDIEQIGAQVGCSPFYLSRIFSREMAMTIPQYLRQIRMERAAELLLSGKYNVTEAALEVGYSSLSHFSKAFCQVIGCCPVLFPSAKALVDNFLRRPHLTPIGSK